MGRERRPSSKNQPNFKLLGYFFEIDFAERDALVKFEASGNGYGRVDDFKISKKCQSICSTIYLASETQDDLTPCKY